MRLLWPELSYSVPVIRSRESDRYFFHLYLVLFPSLLFTRVKKSRLIDTPVVWREFLLCHGPTDISICFITLADCIIAYVDTLLCDCLTMTYKRVITCRQPEIHGGQDCPEECTIGHTIAGSKDCSWDALDAFKCAAATVQPINITFMLIIVSTIYLWLYSIFLSRPSEFWIHVARLHWNSIPLKISAMLPLFTIMACKTLHSYVENILWLWGICWSSSNFCMKSRSIIKPGRCGLWLLHIGFLYDHDNARKIVLNENLPVSKVFETKLKPRSFLSCELMTYPWYSNFVQWRTLTLTYLTSHRP